VEYLIAVDGSPDSTAAVRHAAETARTHAAGVRLAHAVTPRAYAAACSPAAATETDRPESLAAAEERGETALATAADRLREAGVSVVDTHLLYGEPAATIPRVAREHPVAEIVVGHRGHHDTDRLLGSVAVGLLDRADVPVTVVG
jgi:nucleotide-binding universal stress UspA family protein